MTEEKERAQKALQALLEVERILESQDITAIFKDIPPVEFLSRRAMNAVKTMQVHASIFAAHGSAQAPPEAATEQPKAGGILLHFRLVDVQEGG